MVYPYIFFICGIVCLACQQVKHKIDSLSWFLTKRTQKKKDPLVLTNGMEYLSTDAEYAATRTHVTEGDIAMGMPTDTVEAQEFLRYCGAALRTRREVLRRQSLEAGARGLWTMEDVADRLKIGRSTVTDLENGVQWCRMDTVRR